MLNREKRSFSLFARRRTAYLRSLQETVRAEAIAPPADLIAAVRAGEPDTLEGADGEEDDG